MGVLILILQSVSLWYTHKGEVLPPLREKGTRTGCATVVTWRKGILPPLKTPQGSWWPPAKERLMMAFSTVAETEDSAQKSFGLATAPVFKSLPATRPCLSISLSSGEDFRLRPDRGQTSRRNCKLPMTGYRSIAS